MKQAPSYLTYLLGQSLLSGLSRPKLRLAVLVNPVDADGRWRLILLSLAGVALQLLHSGAAIALVVRVLHLVDLFKCRVLAWAIQRTLVTASLSLLGARVGADCGVVDVRQCLAWVRPGWV